MTTTTTEKPRGRPPRRVTSPEGTPRVVWNGEPVDEKGNIVTAPEDEPEDEDLDDDLEDEDEEDEEDELDEIGRAHV